MTAATTLPGPSRPGINRNILFLLADGYNDRDVHEVGAAMERNGFLVTHGGLTAGETVTSQAGRETRIERGYLNFNIGKYDLVIVPRAEKIETVIDHKSMVNVLHTMLHKGRVVATIGDASRILLAVAKQKSPNPIETGVHVLHEDVLKDRRVAVPEALVEEFEKVGANVATTDGVVGAAPVVTATDTDGEHLPRFIEAVVPVVHRVLQRVH